MAFWWDRTYVITEILFVILLNDKENFFLLF